MRAREHEMLMAEKNIELEQAKGAASSASNSSRSSSPILSSEPASSSVKARAPRLPAFDENKDEIDAYLRRFERFAENAGWKRDDWAINLSALLTGKALEVYSRLTSAEADEYDTVKDSLLKRYQLTEEGFRQKFRESKPEKGETSSQFVSRLQSYLGRWMKLGNVAESFEGIKDLFLREQFLGVCNKNLALFLKERTPNSVDEMTNLADKYLEARGVLYALIR